MSNTQYRLAETDEPYLQTVEAPYKEDESLRETVSAELGYSEKEQDDDMSVEDFWDDYGPKELLKEKYEENIGSKDAATIAKDVARSISETAQEGLEISAALATAPALLFTLKTAKGVTKSRIAIDELCNSVAEDPDEGFIDRYQERAADVDAKEDDFFRQLVYDDEAGGRRGGYDEV